MFITQRFPLFYLSTGEEPGGGTIEAHNEGEPLADPQNGAPGDSIDSQPAEVDWQKRYEDLRPEYDRVQSWRDQNEQRLALLEALESDDPQVYNQALQQLGFAAPEEEPEPESDEPYLTREEWQQWQAQMQAAEEAERQQQATQEYIATLDETVESQLDELGLPQGEKDSPEEQVRDWIVSRALALTPSHQIPDMKAAVEAAHKEFQGLLAAQVAAEKRAWAETKKPAHHVAPGGTEGTLVPPRATHEQRVDRAMARLQANQQ